MARPGPALAAASLRYAPLTPTAQSATYGVPGAATTKLKPGVTVRDEKRSGDARAPRKPRAARPAAASCGGISANFKNHSRPSRLLPWLRWAGSVAPFPPPALPQAGERPPPQSATEATNGLPLPCPTPRGRMWATEAKGGPWERRLAASVMRSRIVRSRRGRGSYAPGGGKEPAGSEEEREVGAFPRVPAPRRNRVPELGLRRVLLAVAGQCARYSGWG